MPDRPFDPHWTTDLPTLLEYLHELNAKLTQSERNRLRKRSGSAQKNFEAAVNAIAIDLYRAHRSNPALEVGIGTGQGSLHAKRRSRYGSELYSPRTFRAAMAALIDNGLVLETTPFWDDPSHKNSRTARYKAELRLLTDMTVAGASAAVLRRKRSAETIRLKDNQKHLIDYGDCAFANMARQRLRLINDMLEANWADLALTDTQLLEMMKKTTATRENEAALAFDFAARTVHRVFNNGDWDQGGRFYGAWWISCPSQLRPYILINGKRTVEVDYSGLHAAMLYAQDGQTIPDDPYARCLTKAGNKAERKLVKQTFNALLNADSINKIQEIDDYSPEITGRSWRDFKHFIVSKYPEFRQHFGSGVGLRLQRRDSDLAETVMLKFAAMGYACLPVHDSFIVHHGLEEELDHAMKQAFQDEFRFRPNVGVDAGLGEVVEVSHFPIEVNMEAIIDPVGHETRLQSFWNIQANKRLGTVS